MMDKTEQNNAERQSSTNQALKWIAIIFVVVMVLTILGIVLGMIMVF